MSSTSDPFLEAGAPQAGAPEAADGIAIIGMAGRFPGARDLDAFWQNLLAGRDTVSSFSNQDSDALGPDYVPARGVLDDAAMFDAEYFGIAPREADLLDPQHRVFLEACSNALEDAGYVGSEYPGEIALFGGCSLNTYLLANLAQDRAFLDRLTDSYQVGEFSTFLGNDKDFLTTRVAYKLGLRGPVVTVASACATSLVAICQAAQSLLNFQCDMALAGGVSITFPQERGHLYQEGGIVSKDGHCRPFDAHATGTVFGHGCGVVLLKRLEDALRDGDHIEAVVRGFAVNNDGSGKAGYMAPGVDGQARVIAAAQAMAGITPEQISYIEAHGTGTPLGDPIEVAALTQVFRAATGKTGFCAIGTAKGNVGHLDAAAGVTGVLKTVLSMRHRTLPRLAHFTAPNPHLDLADSPFTFAREARAWTGTEPLRAGVSAFGVGGVNAHIVLEQAPSAPLPARVKADGSALPLPTSERPRGSHVLCVSARSEAAARQAATNLADHLTAHPGTDLADAAYTLAVGRKAHAWRFAVVVEDLQAAREHLLEATPKQVAARKLAFQFSGQGTQFCGMGRDLYESEPVYRAVVDEAAEHLRPHLALDLRTLLFALRGDVEAETQLDRTEFAQPAIFVTSLALAQLWKSRGLVPVAMLGHSLGEYVAATLAGVFTRRAALKLIATRARLMQNCAPGAMLSVPVAESAAQRYLSDEIDLAALNAPRSTVFSGPVSAIAALEARLGEDGIASRRLRTSHAFHSAAMDPMLGAFEDAVREAHPEPPGQRFVSSVSGNWITDAEATSPTYWAEQCRRPVQYRAALATLAAEGCDLLLEVGPGRTLTTLAARQSDAVTVASFSGVASIDAALASLWTAGGPVDWKRVYGSRSRRRLSLPTYPFERRLHWIEPPARQKTATESLPVSSSPPAPPPALSAAEISAAAPTCSRDKHLRAEIAAVLADLSGIGISPAEHDYQFLELGFDSLFLTQATQSLSKKFSIKLTFRQLMEQLSSIAALAAYLNATLPAGTFEPTPTAAAMNWAEPDARASVPASNVEQLLTGQIDALSKLFAQQVASLRAVAGGAPTPYAPAAPPTLAGLPVEATPVEVRFRPPQLKASQDVTATQQAWIDSLISRYELQTPTSKRLTDAGRPQLADPRAVAGFRREWKELVYPLVVDRALGSRLWDIDGNEYIDIVNGYGCILFGHSPDFVVKAAIDQLERGVAIGPQTPLAAEVAALICELTGNERVTFCNTGSEAVMAAIRVARTVTGRDRIVYFSGDYHGTFDEVLVRSTPRGSAPVAPGIPLANVSNVTVLDYGAQASLDFLRHHSAEIAAVLLEPVQTRHPENKPFDFLREVRRITEQTGSAMILDEVVTGFRLAPGGVQELLGIRADLCTYGKVIGGGHPIGVLSGKREYLDALDGGAWQFGDSSGPEVGITFFAGTFVRHPLAMAAARAVLQHLKAAGPGLQRDLNAATAQLAESLDRFFAERNVGARIHHFASWFYFTFPGDARLATLFYAAMRTRGIHIQEGYPCFLTTAHTPADLAAIERAFRDTVIEMQANAALPGGAPEPKPLLLHPFAVPGIPSKVPLTEPQREVFLAAALNDDANRAFNESLTLHLRGKIRRDDLSHALMAAFGRHDALRSTVSPDGDQLLIAGSCKVQPEFIDLRGLSAAQQVEALEAAADHEAQIPFDLIEGPLFRALVYELAEDHLALMLTAHHIVLDGWSANQLLEEAGKIYSAGSAAELQPLLPFSSYAVREHCRQAGGEYVANEIFWVERYEGRSPRLDLPTDRPRPLEKTYRGSTLEGSLGPDLYTVLQKASARAGCSLYVTLLSSFQLLLHRLSGQEEVVVGISTAGQALLDDASLVGHAVNFLPMLSELAPGATAREHLLATKRALLDAYDHQEFTFGSLLRKLRLDREPGRLPLIEVQFNLERVGANVRFDGLTTAMRANRKHFVNTDLFLNVVETATDLEFTLDFNTDLFDESTVQRWMSHWAELLKAEAAGPDSRCDELNLLTAAEHERSIHASEAATQNFGPFTSLVTSFMARAVTEPLSMAVECGGAQWTNAELAAYSLRMAQRLQSEGLRPGQLVGIAVERSLEMLGAMLAVMLAGGAYVPLDPRHPAERLQTVLNDAGAHLLLTFGTLRLTTAARTLDLRDPLPAAETGWQPRAIGSDDLAYVIYTSGSTGQPKGVAVEHGALMNLLHAMRREPGLSHHDTLVAITTMAFDIAGLELLLPLLTGARLVIAKDEEVMDGRLLLGLMERTRATVLQATPGAWRILMDAGWTGSLPLKALCGGEALPRELADQLLDRAGEVWNVYGPTETTIWSSATRVSRGVGPLRLGAPIANTRFYVLDQRRQPAPVGVAGELYIGGAGLARGYWNRPELTAEKFVANPFGAGRLYSTGDLARTHHDGCIELLGRTDFQVKIRGYRIELAEIEAAILAYPGLREVAVAAHKPEGTLSPRLVAYLVHGDTPALSAALTDHLSRTLPDYMIPAAFLQLEKLPRTPNGKLDRKALPQPPSLGVASTESPFVAASTPAEKQLAAIWQDVLELPLVSVRSSIFELGADSLLIFRIAARAQREGLPITATRIFQGRSIQKIVATIEQDEVSTPVRMMPRIVAAARSKYRLPEHRVDA